MRRNLNLNCVLLDISSITLAEKAKRILKSNGIRSELKRSGGGLSGCSYQLKAYSDKLTVMRLLTINKIPILKSSACWKI